MPRQLPWANKGDSSSKQNKQQPQSVKKRCIALDIDDDFFNGTVLASSNKGKERAIDLDDELPDLPAEPSISRTKNNPKFDTRKGRAPSSSPPPIGELEIPSTEFMRKGVSKFELLDDEWMMVEDEFLETAKLFSRHLRLEEYEEVKEEILKKKKEAEIARPVVAHAKLSVDGTVKEKARLQEKKQRQAICDIFAAQHSDDDEEDPSTTRSMSRKSISELAKPSSEAQTMRDPDSDDLDSAKPAHKSYVSKATPRKTLEKTPVTSLSTTSPSSSPAVTHIATPRPNPISSTSNQARTTVPRPSFQKPLPPLASANSRARRPRPTPFDMLDAYAPNKHATAAPAAAARSTKPAEPTTRTSTLAIGETSSPQNLAGAGQEAVGRVSKRKAEREKDTDEKKKRHEKKFEADDIPTFLF